MITNTTRHVSNLVLLFRQYWIYHSKLISTSILGLTGGLFVLLYSIQIFTGFDTWRYEHFMYLFMSYFAVTAVVYSGSSFPGLRSRERGYNYLLLPATITQKYLFELFTRVIFFALLVPSLFWSIFYLEGNFVEFLNPEFIFRSFSFTEGFHLHNETENNWLIIFTAGEGLLFLTAPFFGATVFRIHPAIKTLLLAVAILFGHLLLHYVLQELNVKLFPNSKIGIIFMAIYVMLINVILVVLAYFKLKNKQI